MTREEMYRKMLSNIELKTSNSYLNCMTLMQETRIILLDDRLITTVPGLMSLMPSHFFGWTVKVNGIYYIAMAPQYMHMRDKTESIILCGITLLHELIHVMTQRETPDHPNYHFQYRTGEILIEEGEIFEYLFLGGKLIVDKTAAEWTLDIRKEPLDYPVGARLKSKQLFETGDLGAVRSMMRRN